MRISGIICPKYQYQYSNHNTVFRSKNVTKDMGSEFLIDDTDIYFQPYPQAMYLCVKNRKNRDNSCANVYEYANNEKKFVKTIKPCEEQWTKNLRPDATFFNISDLIKGKDYLFEIGEDFIALNPKTDQQSMLMRFSSLFEGTVGNPIKPGRTVGKLLNIKDENGDEIKKLEDTVNNIKEPVILSLSANQADFLLDLHPCPYIKGLIISSNDQAMPSTSHESSGFRAISEVCVVILPNKNYFGAQLESYEGKYVEQVVYSNGFLALNPAGPEQIEKTLTNKPSVKVPVCDISKTDILLPNECKPDVIGSKAVNLNKLKTLAETGKLDVIIPPFIGLPQGYIIKMFASNPGKLENFDEVKEPYLYQYPYKVCNRDEYCNKLMDDLRRILQENHINSKQLMVRSSFNAEDLPKINSAGIFYSNGSSFENNDLYSTIVHVAGCKISDKVKSFAQRYNIPTDDIQPGVILQKKINTDYKFTIYTDDGYGNLIMDITNTRDEYFSAFAETMPYKKIIYNKALKTISALPNTTNVLFKTKYMNPDVDSMVLPYEFFKYEDATFKKYLKKIIKNALVVEKEFGAPQDTEGGFNLGRTNEFILGLKSFYSAVINEKVLMQEGLVVSVLALLSGLSNGSLVSGLYGFLGASTGMLLGNIIKSFKVLKNLKNFRKEFFNESIVDLKNVREKNIYFWQTRNVIDLGTKVTHSKLKYRL